MSFVRNKIKYSSYDNEEPPEKKIISDGDMLIKKLAKKQQNTKVNLKEQLLNPKVFEKSTNLIPITRNFKGECGLLDFEKATLRLEEHELFKSAGLSDEDIQMVLDFREGTLYDKHRNFEQNLLRNKIDKLLTIIDNHQKKHQACDSNKVIHNRQKTEFGLSVKPHSVQTKLLKFALQNEPTKQSSFPHPIDNIKDIEQKLFEHLNDEVKPPINIQKKLRKLAKEVNNISNHSIMISDDSKSCGNNSNRISYVQESKWDKKEANLSDNDCAETVRKKYSCKPCNYYAIRNGVIVKLSASEINNKNSNVAASHKLSVDEIKKLPKFVNYEAGIPSPILYAKNLPRNIKELDLRTVFSKYNKDDCLQFRLMTGRMKGQAFITFADVAEATTALEDINGTVIMEKPIVLEFGKLLHTQDESLITNH